ncbi:MAG: histidine--tRNA ligase [Bifidobacteriaceae bacterium]|jgi:histidyl-tRNA synthetase|nr:histidine--tRNA ligase [Bifidobacteriaceae bacterium]
MARPRPLSGFPEWLPPARAVERHLIGRLARVFELHGFVEIETRAVEPLSDLLRKGETSKEVYVLRRLQEVERTGLDAKTLGLHFDLTVPLARYVLQNAGQLDFPFKRYQIQKVWRGERPQEGRFREFVQADLDVIGLGQLPFHYEVELPLIMAEALAQLGVGDFRVLVNNRKVAEGFYRLIGLEQPDQIGAVSRWIDKLDKVGPAGVAEGLAAEGLSPAQVRAALDLAAISGADPAAVVASVRRLAAAVGAQAAADAAGPAPDAAARDASAGRALLDQGLAELGGLLEAARRRAAAAVVADLKIARGLDYYTGSVYETVWVGQESLGSVCSGGRYDSLASVGGQTYPGVGLSIGVSRLVSRVLALGLLEPSRLTPAAVLVAVADEADRATSDDAAARLRARGIAAEVAPAAAKFGKQLKYADKRGIPFVWFPGAADGGGDQVKDLRSGEQTDADADVWRPPPADLEVGFGRPAAGVDAATRIHSRAT